MRLPATISEWFGRHVALAIAGLMAIGIFILLVLLMDTARQENRRSADMARSLVEQGFHQKEVDLARQVRDYASWGEAYRNLHAATNVEWAYGLQNLGPTLFRDLGIDFVFVVGPTDATTYGVVAGNLSTVSAIDLFGPRLARLVARLREGGTEATPPIADVMVSSGTPVLLAAAALNRGQDVSVATVPGPPSVLIFGDVLTAEGLEESRTSIFANLRAVTAPGGSTANALPIGLPTEPALAYLMWDPDQPGDRLIRRLLPWIGTLLAALVLLATIILVHGARTARRLRESSTRLSDARSRSQYLLLHDVGTGLPNDRLLQQMLERSLVEAVPQRATVALLHIHLTRLTAIHDVLGSEVSNQVVAEMAHRLKGKARDYDIIGRVVGGDFVVGFTGTLERAEIEQISRRFIDVIAAPVHTTLGELRTSAAIGIALAPADADSAEELLRRARLAMGEAIRDGSDDVIFFRPSMERRIEERQLLETELREAVARQEFQLAFQPRYLTSSQRLVGVEALVRWPHKRLGVVNPAEFIPLAEETGLIVAIGEWVLREACQFAAGWPDLAVSVNLSPVQFRRSDLVAKVQQVLAQTGLESHRLELELTESTLLENTELSLAQLQQLRAHGIRLAIDDFGTGYSSLGYLRCFPFERIKIDRSFIVDLSPSGQARAIIQAIIDLAHALGMSVTAEGVETPEQLVMLQADGCDEVQGFLLARPMPAEQLVALLAQRSS
ncbi:putative bifunctional diguanylate cyclase/phosphodiesterase [Ancylobacter terrae]|uniref:putative bifunctional diguanylate cyclase/phosphodiesterase n=1 Tax=Ancylobacter sp. sgz301288 TaxID=3342077 RepID=UPI00385E2917